MVKIIADTTSSLPRSLAAKLGIPYLPQIIIFGDETYRDDTEIDTATFLKKLRSSSTLPKTAAPPPALYAPIYEELSAQGHSIIVLAPSSSVSGTYRSAQVAAQDFPHADIRVVDTRTIAGGLGSLVLQAHRWAEQGIDADTIVSRIKEMAPHEHLYFVVATLEYLHRGGRIGGAAALFGSLLQVKPILTIKDGRIEPFEKQLTHKRAMARMRELIYSECPKNNEDTHLCVMHGDAEREASLLAQELCDNMGLKEVPLYELPPAVLTHAGPGPIVVSFFTP